MLEVVVGGALAGLGAFVFGYLALLVVRLFDRHGLAAQLLEKN
ncbi:hypothetical protein [Terricaulis sp.]|nr:hypothetical protein [Terricaulis sp.]MDZ4692268.1 hypothetical protein [Terricaulis sp.]